MDTYHESAAELMSEPDSELLKTNLKYVLGDEWELLYRPTTEAPLAWRWNSHKPRFGLFLYRRRRGSFDWAPVPVEPIAAVPGSREHTFHGHFSIDEAHRRHLSLKRFLKLSGKHPYAGLSGGSDYRWRLAEADDANCSYTLSQMDHEQWEYAAIPVVERFTLSWGWCHTIRQSWWRELVPLIVSRLFTRGGVGARVATASFSDDPIYLRAAFMVFRRPRAASGREE